MNKKTVVVALLVVFAIVGGGLVVKKKFDEKSAAESAKTEQKKVAENAALTFTSKEITKPVVRKLSGNLQWSGNLVANQTVMVRSKTSGTLLALSVKEGDVVRAGQIIGTIDTSDFKNRINERQAGIEGAQASVSNAQRVFDSNKNLAEKGFISGAALDSSRTQLEAAQAQLKAARAQGASVQLALREAQLLAPIAGTVSKRNALAGEKLSMEQVIVTIIQTNPIEMSGTLAPHQITALKIGMPVVAQIDGLSGNRVGKLERIGPIADIGSKAIPVIVRFDNADGLLQPGQFGQAQTNVADESDSLTIPVQAVSTENGQQVVWVVEASKLQRRYVKLGKRDESGILVQVIDGLKVQDNILSMRFDGLKEGRAVTIQGSK